MRCAGNVASRTVATGLPPMCGERPGLACERVADLKCALFKMSVRLTPSCRFLGHVRSSPKQSRESFAFDVAGQPPASSLGTPRNKRSYVAPCSPSESVENVEREAAGATVTCFVLKKVDRRELPAVAHYRSVVRFGEDPNRRFGAWDVEFGFEDPPIYGCPTLTTVSLLAEGAPNQLLHVGSRFELTEGRRVVQGQSFNRKLANDPLTFPCKRLEFLGCRFCIATRGRVEP